MQQESPEETYRKNRATYKEQHAALSRRYNRLSLLRLCAALLALTALAGYLSRAEPYLLGCAFASGAAFVLLLRYHHKTGLQRARQKMLWQINEEELAFLEGGTLPFPEGSEYRDEQHAYAADLDIFGPRSLYQHLNRTATRMGSDRLAAALLRPAAAAEIRLCQEAVAQWSGKPEERQQFYASARLAADGRAAYEQLLRWAAQKDKPLPAWLRMLCYLLTALLAGLLITYLATREVQYRDWALRLCVLNLLVFSFRMKQIKKALWSTDKVQELLQEYAAMLQQIEAMPQPSEKIQQLRNTLQQTGAGQQLHKLAKLYAGLETIQNPFAATISNALYFNHIHLLHRLLQWKQRHAVHIPVWLGIIGEIEMLGSLANFRYNNPGYAFPQLNEQGKIAFRELGHPLIPAGKRVCNNIRFDPCRMVILTGSNMSGKSTFLRTLGINMVLAGTGSAVCAAAAELQPLPVLVSMRQADSLADSESYFFAEVKRLRYIMEQAQAGPSFVLLDEILRGTNSDDKRSGTIGVIEKMAGLDTIGVIATHDLEVCQLTGRYPAILSNKCFEVEITADGLEFDYKLREGVCHNKSATFLMKKMHIIP